MAKRYDFPLKEKQQEDPRPTPKPQVVKENVEIYALIVDCESLNIRRKPEKDAEVISVVKKGTRIEVSTFVGEWAFIYDDEQGIEGYVMRKFLRIC